MSGDSDHSTSWWQTVSTSMNVERSARGFMTLRLVQAYDPSRRSAARSVEAGASFAQAGLALTGSLGASVLRPTSGEERSTLTGRAIVSGALGTRTRARVEYAHFPFDETARLIDTGLDVQLASADADIGLPLGITMSAGGSMLWLTDGNDRGAAFAALSRTTGPVMVGAYARGLGWAERSPDYYSPDRFTVIEARTRLTARVKRWESQLGAGIGAQQVDPSAATQTEWHIEARLARAWSDAGRIELFGGATNSAEVSYAGAYRSYNAGLSVLFSL